MLLHVGLFDYILLLDVRSSDLEPAAPAHWGNAAFCFSEAKEFRLAITAARIAVLLDPTSALPSLKVTVMDPDSRSQIMEGSSSAVAKPILASSITQITSMHSCTAPNSHVLQSL